jgi:hypothetical protein
MVSMVSMVPIGSSPPDRQGTRQVRDQPHPANTGPGHIELWTRGWSGSAHDRGVELEIVALDLPEEIVVIHVMPTDLKK